MIQVIAEAVAAYHHAAVFFQEATVLYPYSCQFSGMRSNVLLPVHASWCHGHKTSRLMLLSGCSVLPTQVPDSAPVHCVHADRCDQITSGGWSTRPSFARDRRRRMVAAGWHCVSYMMCSMRSYVGSQQAICARSLLLHLPCTRLCSYPVLNFTGYSLVTCGGHPWT